jgi:hypothetical protein
MMSETRAKQKRFEELCVKALDQACDAQEIREFEIMLQGSLEYKKEYEAMKKVREVTREMQFSTPSDAVWDHYWTDVYHKIERGIGWIIFTIGGVILATWGLFRLVESIIADPNLTLIVKIGVLLFSLGFSILIISLIREHCFMSNHDPYKEIRR